MSRHRGAITLCGLLMVALATPSRGLAQARVSGERSSRLFYQSLSTFTYNPMRFQTSLELDWRHKLFDPKGSELLQNNYASVFVAPILSPASARLGVGAKLRPLNIFKLELRLEYLGFFGDLGQLPSFASPRDDFSDDAIAAASDEGRNYATQGWQLTIDGELRVKLGPVILRSRARAIYVDVSLERGDTVWYSERYDLLLPEAGWLLTNDADLLVQLGSRVIIGVRHSLGVVGYPSSAYRPGEPRQNDNSPTQRLGPLIAYRFYDDPGASFNRPTLVLIAAWHLQHRWRTGAAVDQAIPTLTLGFAFNGDLL